MIPMVEIRRQWIETLGCVDPCERLLPPSPVDENIGEDGGDIGIVGVGRECPFKVDFGLVVSLEQEQQLTEDTVRPGIAIVDVEGPLYMPQRLVQRCRARCFEEHAADMGPGDVRVGACIKWVKRDGTAEIIQGFGQVFTGQTPPSFVPEQDKIICGEIRGLLALGEIAAGILEPFR